MQDDQETPQVTWEEEAWPLPQAGAVLAHSGNHLALPGVKQSLWTPPSTGTFSPIWVFKRYFRAFFFLCLHVWFCCLFCFSKTRSHYEGHTLSCSIAWVASPFLHHVCSFENLTYFTVSSSSFINLLLLSLAHFCHAEFLSFTLEW